MRWRRHEPPVFCGHTTRQFGGGAPVGADRGVPEISDRGLRRRRQGLADAPCRPTADGSCPFYPQPTETDTETKTHTLTEISAETDTKTHIFRSLARTF